MLVSKTNTAALALYDKNGFERCGEVFISMICYEMLIALRQNAMKKS
jgi:ribosomal protein S18 acetylase RimI-like enzyme